MTDDQASAVCQRVKDYFGGPRGPGFDIGNPQHFQLLVNHVQAGVADIAEDDLFVVTAMCWLGLDLTYVPPRSMREELLDILRRLEPDSQKRVARVMEFAIAYGCGKWRGVERGYGSWERQWQGAVGGLVRALEPAVNQSNRWLEKAVVGFPKNRDASSDAWVLAMWLKHPEKQLHLSQEETLIIKCTVDGTQAEVSTQGWQENIPPGAKAVWTVAEGQAEFTRPHDEALAPPTGSKAIVTARDDEARIEVRVGGQVSRWRLEIDEESEAKVREVLRVAIWECTCGTTHCIERHRLEGWDPARVSLWAFVASAVKGPQPSIQTGSSVQGMYFPLLAKERIL